MAEFYMLRNRYLVEVELELDNIKLILEELSNVVTNLKHEEPDLILKAATSSFMAQYYNGIENILKRITKYFNIPLPKTESWHYELFTYFCEPPQSMLPVLFDSGIKAEINELRKFRHRVHHGYSFTLDWNDLLIGANSVLNTFVSFSKNVSAFLDCHS